MISTFYRVLLRPSSLPSSTYDTVLDYDSIPKLKRALSGIRIGLSNKPENYIVYVYKYELYYDSTDHLIKERSTDITASVLGG